MTQAVQLIERKEEMGLLNDVKRNKLWTLAASLALVFAVGMVGLVMTYLHEDVDMEIYQERAFHLRETMIITAEKVDWVLADRWKTLNQVSSYLEYDPTVQSGTISGSIAEIKEKLYINDCDLFLVDDEGMYYCNALTEGRATWTAWKRLLNGEKQQVVLMNHAFDNAGGERMGFLMKLDHPVVCGGSVITHVGLLVDMELFQHLFRSQIYDEKNQTIVLDSDGVRVYYDLLDDTFDGYNVLRSIAGDQVLNGEDMETLMAHYAAGESAVAEIIHGNSTYFVGFTPLAGGWMYLTFVPEAYVSASTVGFTTSITRSYWLIIGIPMVFFLIIVVGGMYLINRNNNLKRARRTNHELKKAREKAEEAEAQARQTSKAKSDFLSNMSHDIRTPINGIIGMIAIARGQRENPAKLMECIDKIQGATDHLLQLINDVLDMSKAESGKIKLSRKPMDIVKSLTDCANIEHSQASERSLNLECDFAGIEHRYLYGSPLHLRQILLNILGNAVKYTKPGGHIRFSARELPGSEDKATMEITVADNGIGMSEEFLKHIFEPFTQEESAVRSEYKGTGLGMAITRNLVELMGGNISVTSTKGVGSTFVVRLPFEIDKDPQITEEVLEPEDADIKGMRILLAEDNDLNMEIATTILEGEGALITGVENGLLAVESFEASKPYSFDAILLDVMMPEMNGYEATEAIRRIARPDAATIPIIAMTANAFAEDVAKAKAAGMNDHIAKPLDIDNLLKTLAKYKRKKHR